MEFPENGVIGKLPAPPPGVGKLMRLFRGNSPDTVPETGHAILF